MLLRAEAFKAEVMGPDLVVAFAVLGGGVGAVLALAGVAAAGGVLLGREGPLDF